MYFIFIFPKIPDNESSKLRSDGLCLDRHLHRINIWTQTGITGRWNCRWTTCANCHVLGWMVDNLSQLHQCFTTYCCLPNLCHSLCLFHLSGETRLRSCLWFNVSLCQMTNRGHLRFLEFPRQQDDVYCAKFQIKKICDKTAWLVCDIFSSPAANV